jgi:cellulose synthase/poly-beta-1,6-N-acetylglucosamine synthase-like glycosyltransferase
MFVGTNYVIRFAVLDQIGGFQPCITEDMATGLAVHASRNPSTGERWKSVYTPDVLAVGEGPASWGPFFAQQWRWAAGTFDTLRRVVWRIFFKIRPKSLLQYTLMLTYYPMAAITWILAISSSMMYLVTGATAILAPWGQFVTLYMMGLVMQFSLYFWNRRFNVSPHEPAGSYGVAGMAISALTAPIYFSALLRILLGKKPNFVVTTKGGTHNLDHISSFRSHYLWATLLVGGLVYGIANGHDHPAMLVWVGTLIVVCLTPIAIATALHIQVLIRNAYASLHLRINGEPKGE